MGTRSTLSVDQQVQQLTLSEDVAGGLGETLQLALAMANSMATNAEEEEERQKGNEALFNHLNQHASDYTMTAESMQQWNGDCWFAATAFHLNRIQSSGSQTITAAKLRKDLCNYMSSEPKKQEYLDGPFFVDKDYESADVTKSEQYDKEIAFMKKKGNWNSNSNISDIAVVCLAQITDSLFTIHQSGNKTPLIVGDENARNKFHFGRIMTSSSAHIHALVRKKI